MVEFLIGLGRANLAAAVAILAVLVLRKPVRSLFGARIAYGLWALPAVSVTAAFLPARVLLVPTLSRTPGIDGPVQILTFDGATIPAAHPLIDPSQALFILWAAGVIAAFAILIRSQRRFLTDAAAGRVGPAVVGVVAPRIIKPEDFTERFSPDEQRLVLAHEAAHVARQDSRLNGLFVLAQCLCWFNPIIHLGAHLARIDQEMACDEVVISRFPRARAAYARALMKAQLAIRPLPLGCYWPSRTEHPLLERLAMIKRDTFSRARRTAGAAALALLCATASAAAWAAQPARMIVATLPPAAPAQGPTPTPTPTAQSKTPPSTATAAAPDTPPAQVCISNSCMTHTAASTSLSDAIARGDAAAVVAMGGSGKDAIAALRNGPVGSQRGPNGESMAEKLDQMAAMDTVTIANLDGGGRSSLVGTNDAGGRMLLIFPQLGPAPDTAPVYDANLPPPPADGGALRIGPDGVQTIVPTKAPASYPASQPLQLQPLIPPQSQQIAPTPALLRTKIPVVRPSDIVSQPTSEQMQALLPSDAAVIGLKGQVVLRCKVGLTGDVRDCAVAGQSEPSAALGATALKAAALFKLKPRLVDGRPADGALVLISLKFDVKVDRLGSYPMRATPNFYGAGAQPVVTNLAVR